MYLRGYKKSRWFIDNNHCTRQQMFNNVNTMISSPVDQSCGWFGSLSANRRSIFEDIEEINAIYYNLLGELCRPLCVFFIRDGNLLFWGNVYICTNIRFGQEACLVNIGARMSDEKHRLFYRFSPVAAQRLALK